MGVLSDDFATVDVREGLCYHSRPKKQIQEVNGTAKPIMRKLCAAEKAAADPQAVQRGRLRAAALSVWFSCHFSVCFSVACAWLRRAQRAALVYAKHTPWCQKTNKRYLFLRELISMALHIKIVAMTHNRLILKSFYGKIIARMLKDVKRCVS